MFLLVPGDRTNDHFPLKMPASKMTEGWTEGHGTPPGTFGGCKWALSMDLCFPNGYVGGVTFRADHRHLSLSKRGSSTFPTHTHDDQLGVVRISDRHSILSYLNSTWNTQFPVFSSFIFFT